MKTGIVAFAFGVPWSIRSNKLIASIAMGEALDLNSGINAPIYTQKDILINKEIFEVTYTVEESKNPPPTLRIARGAIQWAIQNKLTSILIVCAEPHLWRCKRDLKKAVKEAHTGFMVDHSRKITGHGEEWFCLDSTQPRTKSSKEWNKREKILKLMPFWLYKRVAS